MNLSVTEKGVLIPRQWLKGVDEVEIRRENHLILIIPINTPKSILQLNRKTAEHTKDFEKEKQVDADYQAAMQSYFSRPDYLFTHPDQDYPKRDTLYDRDIMFH